MLIYVHTTVTAQPVCDGLTQLAANANQSLFLTGCSRDANCSMISCQITDAATRMLVQETDFRILPCSVPLPQLQFELLDGEVVRYSQLIMNSGQLNISVFSPLLQTTLPLGTLITEITHSPTTIGITVKLISTNQLLSLLKVSL